MVTSGVHGSAAAPEAGRTTTRCGAISRRRAKFGLDATAGTSTGDGARLAPAPPKCETRLGPEGLEHRWTWWARPDGDTQIKRRHTKCVILRPQPKNLVAEHAFLPASLQKFLLVRKVQHIDKHRTQPIQLMTVRARAPTHLVGSGFKADPGFSPARRLNVPERDWSGSGVLAAYSSSTRQCTMPWCAGFAPLMT